MAARREVGQSRSGRIPALVQPRELVKWHPIEECRGVGVVGELDCNPGPGGDIIDSLIRRRRLLLRSRLASQTELVTSPTSEDEGKRIPLSV